MGRAEPVNYAFFIIVEMATHEIVGKERGSEERSRASRAIAAFLCGVRRRRVARELARSDIPAPERNRKQEQR